jgi:hypothetical protein
MSDVLISIFCFRTLRSLKWLFTAQVILM